MAAERVLVLCGGRSAEHEISLLSARFIAESLDPERHEALIVGIDKQGRWRLVQRLDQAGARDVVVDRTGPLCWIAPMPSETGRGELCVAGREPLAFDVVFPVLHGPMGEDGTIQGLLELAAVPYVGAGVLGSAVGMDKVVQKRLLQQAELPVVPYHAFTRPDFERDQAGVIGACEALGYPLFVKPANMGSSLGVSRAVHRAGLQAGVALALELDDKILVEKGLDRPREIELSVLGNDEPIVSLPGEIVVRHGDGFYSYDAKYLDPDGADLCVPAELDGALTAAVQLLAIQAFRALDCAGMARVDLFVTPATAYLNEINTIPGFTSISMYPRLWQRSGVGARELVTRLVELARERHDRRSALRTTR